MTKPKAKRAPALLLPSLEGPRYVIHFEAGQGAGGDYYIFNHGDRLGALSPKEARKLAAYLVKAADWSDAQAARRKGKGE